MSESDAGAVCPSGHAETVKLLSVFASVTAGGGGEPAPAAPAPAMRGCGGACACHP